MFVDQPRHTKTKGATAESARQAKRQQKMLRDNRTVCDARRRSDGQPCEALSVPGKQRCKWHGGCSTGPRTAEGKASVAESLQRPRQSI